MLEADPDHFHALVQRGEHELQQNDPASALAYFRRAAEVDATNVRVRINIAMAYKMCGDDAEEEAALTLALAIDPYDLLALTLRGRLYERQGRNHAAAAAYGAAACVAPSRERLPAALRRPLEYARRFRAAHQERFGAFLDEALARDRNDVPLRERRRFDLAVDIMLGRKARFDSQPVLFYIPGLMPTEFFERSRFPWLDAIEAGTDAIRREFLAVLQSDAGFVPYIQYSADQPVAQWAELNNNPSWSAFHLVQNGLTVEENATQCPETIKLWRDHVPAPDQPGRTPVALYSLLKARTRIPPHVGASNARVVTHLPLIIPAGCQYRVGNTVREWVPGKAWVFDDTIEHEARNDSDQVRVVFIFDIWHPDLSLEEQHMITALNTAMNGFSNETWPEYGA